MSDAKKTPLAEIDGLVVEFAGPRGTTRAVDGLSLTIGAGETVAIVGESGCGKSVTSLSLLRLVKAPGRIAAGSIRLEGRDLLALPEREMRRVRGRDVAMVFQEPATALNPVLTLGQQITEPLRLHLGLDRKAARARAIELLASVQIASPERRVDEYPHQLSGGMRQRAMIAMALACEPRLLVADEPTTALDVTIQAQILHLMRDLKARTGTAILLVTHDLGVVAEMAERVAVMYAGRKIEEAPAAAIFARPRHPYTRALMRATPRLDDDDESPPRLAEIPGTVPVLTGPATACSFADRCPLVEARCRAEVPQMRDFGGGHQVACHRAHEEATA